MNNLGQFLDELEMIIHESDGVEAVKAVPTSNPEMPHSADNNVRMILPPSAGGAASVIYICNVGESGSPRGLAFDGTHINLDDGTDVM